MTKDSFKQLLAQHNCTYDEKPIQHGTQFRCHTGEIFNLYNTGKIVPAGVSSDFAKQITAAAKLSLVGISQRPQTLSYSVPVQSIPTDVFVVYGRDIPARDQLELSIRRMGLNPIILSALPASGDTLIEKLDSYLSEKGKVAYACVLITPDDEGHIAGAPSEKKYRARQNVVMELGMVLAGLGRKRVAILIKRTVEQPSDIAGLIYIPFEEHVSEIEMKLYNEFLSAGLSPKLP